MTIETPETTETTEQQTYPTNWLIGQDFDPKDHLMQLKGKDYLNVQNRLIWFIRDQRALIAQGLAREPYAAITELVEHDTEKQWANFKTTVRDVLGNVCVMYGSEGAKDFGDYLEKASTKSLGRALIGLGYGTQFAPEMDEGERVVDAPVPPRAKPATQPSAQPAAAQRPAQSPSSQPPRQPTQPVVQPTAPSSPRVGMLAEEERRYDEYITRFGKEFMMEAIAKSGYSPKQANGKTIRQTITETQIETLFEHINEWYSEWLAKRESMQESTQESTQESLQKTENAPAPEDEQVDEPVNEEARAKELRSEILSFCIDMNGNVSTKLFAAAIGYILPRIPVPAGMRPLAPQDLRDEHGKSISDIALLRKHNISLKTYNDLIESLLNPESGDEDTLIVFLAKQAERLGVQQAA